MGQMGTCFRQYAVFVATLVIAVQVHATTIYVKWDAVGAGNGTSWSNAFTTIQAGINAANDNDTVMISEGVYREVVTILGRNGISIVGAGMDRTIIDGERKDLNGVISVISPYGTHNIIVQDLTVRNGYVTGINLQDHGSTDAGYKQLLRVRCERNGGSGASLIAERSLVRNCIFSENSGTGISVEDSWDGLCYASFQNNAFVRNGRSGITAGYYEANVYATNNIFMGNAEYAISIGKLPNSSPSLVANYNLTTGNGKGNYFFSYVNVPISLGPNDLVVDPLFVAATLGDYHLCPGSPCINAGNPASVFNDPDATRNDIGVFGGPAATTGLSANAGPDQRCIASTLVSLDARSCLYKNGGVLTYSWSPATNNPETVTLSDNNSTNAMVTTFVPSACGIYIFSLTVNNGATSSSPDSVIISVRTNIIASVPENYGTIQTAVDNTLSGDTILVGAGTYSDRLVINRAVCLRGAGVDSAFLYPTGSITTYADCEISGFSIVASNNSSVVNIRAGSPLFERNSIEFRSKYGLMMGSLFWCGTSTAVRVVNNTFLLHYLGSSYGGIVISVASNSAPVIKNNIFHANLKGSSSPYGIWCMATNYDISYNCVYGFGMPYAGVIGNQTGTRGNISEDPQFEDYDAFDYRLFCLSAAIDAGDPESSCDPDGSRADMGCHSFTHIPAAPPTPTNLSVAITPTNLCLSWGIRPTSEVDSFIVYRATNAYPTSVLTTVAYPAMSLVDTNVIPDVMYYYRLACLGTNGVTGYYSRQARGAPHDVIRRVPSGFAKIQTALNACYDGDTVIVSDGTYFENLRWPQRNGVTLCSANGPESTTVNGSSSNESVLYVGNGQKDVNIGGFTITGGRGSLCTFHGSTRFGAGILIDELVAGRISNCVVTANGTTNTYGGGIFVSIQSGIDVENCRISWNISDEVGGIYYRNFADRGSIRNCVLYGNSARWGGAVFCQSSPIHFANNTIVSNKCGTGGVNFYTPWPTTVNNIIASNTGYAIWSDQSSSSNMVVCNDLWGNSSGNIIFINGPPPDVNVVGTNGNISANPLFTDAAAWNYRLKIGSPCLNAGINEAWMQDVPDVDGNPRILNGRADIGAHETPFFVNARVFLQGAYDAGMGTMTAELGGRVPLTSPYATDGRTVKRIPTNTTDWMQLELVSTNGRTFAAKSVFVNRQGYVQSDAGTTGVVVEISSGVDCYVALKHRNHLAVMSATPLAFTNQVLSCDFTAGSDRYWGGIAGCVELKPGVWGMIAGDADGDGEILQADGDIRASQTNCATGYWRGDFNLDGAVDGEDETLLAACAGRSSAISNALTALSPALQAIPARVTVVSGTSNVFAAAGCTGTLHWTFVRNSSGGRIETRDATSVWYTAGITSDCIDTIECWETVNPLGRAYANVISASSIDLAGKAVVIAGRKGPTDSLWPATDYLADFGYNTLLYRGFSKTNVQYLSPVTGEDADGNGAADDVDMRSTLANAAFTFTNWAGNMDKLFVYMVDHGNSAANGTFYLDAGETLTSGQLDAWLDAMQDRWSNEVVVVLDFCNAGIFVDALTYTGSAKRVVIASCRAEEESHFVAGGLVSFSDAFFSGVLMGLDVMESFTQARDAMGMYQEALIDDNGGGMLAVGMYIGATFVAGKDIPQIGLVCGNQLLNGSTRATLWAGDVVSVYPLEKVWCMIVPPGYDPPPGNPVVDLPELDLTFNPTNARYEASYEGFSEEGTYKIAYLAKDICGSVSLPVQSYITQIGYVEKVVLVAGGPTGEDNWSRFNKMGNKIYDALIKRWFTGSNVCYLNAQPGQDVDKDGFDDVDDLPSLSSLAYAVTNWATGANKLTIFILGEGVGESVRLNDSEYLGAADLDMWVDIFQTSNADACVVLDFSRSASFLPWLKPPAGALRVCIASAINESCNGVGGLVSFVQYFITHVLKGENIASAFDKAKKAIYATVGQSAAMDDNGDGVSDKNDGNVAKNWHIGKAFMTGGDTPEIGSVPENMWLLGTNGMLLWAAQVTDMDGISNVWAMIIPPRYDGQSDVPETNLTWNATAGRYEGWYGGFGDTGTYVCTFCASDTKGELSALAQCRVKTGDNFEPDDTAQRGTAFAAGSLQSHNFHQSNDEDWVWFCASSNYVYEIRPYQTGTNVDAAVDVYLLQEDGSLQEIWSKDDYGKGTGVCEYVCLSFPQDGLYYVRVRNADAGGTGWGEGSEYDLSIDVPTAQGGVLCVMVINGLTDKALSGGIKVRLSSGDEKPIGGKISESFAKGSGFYTVSLIGVPAGWKYTGYPAIQTVSLANGGFAGAYFVLIPYVAATGSVSDAWTGESIGGAALLFTGTSGRMNGKTVQTNWTTRSDGGFPSGLELVAENWSMQATKAGYSNLMLQIEGSALSAGTVSNLGARFMIPVDTNLNNIADTWEMMYFGAGTNVDGEADSDRDGHSNMKEYRLGTDPTNEQSVLKLRGDRDSSAQKLSTLKWPVSSGRKYRILTRDNLAAGSWNTSAGPWTASFGQTNMTWIDNNSTSIPCRYYRIEVDTR